MRIRKAITRRLMGMVRGIKLISNMVIKVILWSSSVRSVITATEPKILDSRTGQKTTKLGVIGAKVLKTRTGPRTTKTGEIGAVVFKTRIVPCMAIKVALKSCSVSKWIVKLTG